MKHVVGLLVLAGVTLLTFGCEQSDYQSRERGIYVRYTGRYIVSQLSDGWLVTSRNVEWTFDELAYHMILAVEEDPDSRVCQVDGLYRLGDRIELTPFSVQSPNGTPCDSADSTYNPTGTFDFIRAGDTIKLVQRDTLNGLVKELVLWR